MSLAGCSCAVEGVADEEGSCANATNAAEHMIKAIANFFMTFFVLGETWENLNYNSLDGTLFWKVTNAYRSTVKTSQTA
jgi:hypothetical protein